MIAVIPLPVTALQVIAAAVFLFNSDVITDLAMREYIESRKTGLYFSFRNISYDLALKVFARQYPDVFHNCMTWERFFKCLDDKLGFREYASIVFEDVDFDRMDPEFINELRTFLKRHDSRNVFIILTGRRAPSDDAYVIRSIERLTAGEVKKSFPKYNDIDRMRLLALTDGYPGLLNMFDPSESIRGNMISLFSEGTRFLRQAEIRFRESFRSPESYSSLLYAMADGIHRLTELAEYSGYAPNKCDKYLRAMIDAGLVATGIVRSDDGRTKRGYFLESSYMALWARFCMNRMHGQNEDELCDEILSCIDREYLPGFFRQLCGIWIREHQNKLHPSWLSLDDESNYDIVIGNVTFDYVQRDGEKMLFVKIWYDLESTRGKEDWIRIQEAVTAVNTFYNSEIVLCSLRRFRDTMWKYSEQFSNLHLMEVRFMMTGDETWDIKKQIADRFFGQS